MAEDDLFGIPQDTNMPGLVDVRMARGLQGRGRAWWLRLGRMTLIMVVVLGVIVLVASLLSH